MTTPQKFQSKRTIEAMQLTAENVKDVSLWCGGRSYWVLKENGEPGDEVPEVSLSSGATVCLGEYLTHIGRNWQVLSEEYLLAHYAPISPFDDRIAAALAPGSIDENIAGVAKAKATKPYVQTYGDGTPVALIPQVSHRIQKARDELANIEVVVSEVEESYDAVVKERDDALRRLTEVSDERDALVAGIKGSAKPIGKAVITAPAAVEMAVRDLSSEFIGQQVTITDEERSEVISGVLHGVSHMRPDVHPPAGVRHEVHVGPLKGRVSGGAKVVIA